MVLDFRLIGNVITLHYAYDMFSLCNAAFTLITIRPRLVSWSSSWTNRDYPIQSYQIASHLGVNRDNRANRRNFLSAKNFAMITTIGGTIVTIASDPMTS